MKLKRFLLILCLTGWSLSEIRAEGPVAGHPNFLIEIRPVEGSRSFSLTLTNKSASKPASDVWKDLEASVLLMDSKPHKRTKGITWRGSPDLTPGGQLEMGLNVDDWGLQETAGSHRLVLEIAGQRSKAITVKLPR